MLFIALYRSLHEIMG